jgi:hypothetical protein
VLLGAKHRRHGTHAGRPTSASGMPAAAPDSPGTVASRSCAGHVCASPGPAPCAPPMRPPAPPSVPSSPRWISSSAVARASSASTPQAPPPRIDAKVAGLTARRVGRSRRAHPLDRESTASAEAPSASRRSGVPALIRSPTGCGCRWRPCPGVRAPARSRRSSSPGAGPRGRARATSSARLSGRSSGQTWPSTRRMRAEPSGVPARPRDPRPLRPRPQPDGGLGHGERRGVGRGVRPSHLPEDGGTAGEPASAESWKRSCSGSSSSGAPGSVLGMKRRSPSSMRGRNSRPSPGSSGRQERSAAPAMARVQPGTGEGHLDEGAGRGRTSRRSVGSRTPGPPARGATGPAARGARVSATRAAAAITSVLLAARA